MKKIFDNVRARVRQNWRNVMDSTKKKMSLGAQNISKILPWARGDSWRRKNEKKHKHE